MWARLNARLGAWSENERLARAVEWVMRFYALIVCVNIVRQVVFGRADINSDFFYNYAAGFIRRGMSGSILIWLNETFGADPFRVLWWACLIGFLLVAAYFIVLFRRRGLNWYILATCVMLGSVMINGLHFYRRDFITIGVLALVFLLFRRMRLWQWVAVGNALCCFAILNHEAFFFYSTPILMLATHTRCPSWPKAVLAWAPTVVAFALCCIYKGTPEMLGPILAAVEGYFEGTDYKFPWMLSFIGSDGLGTMRFHFNMNFLGYHGLVFPLYTLYIWLIYHAATYSPTLLSATPHSAASQRSLARIMLIQWICLLPMWTILSIDYSRDALYWVMSSYVAWLSLSEGQASALLPARLTAISDAAGRRLQLGIRPCKASCWAAIVVMGIPTWTGAPETLVTSSIYWGVLYHPYRAVKDLLLLFLGS